MHHWLPVFLTTVLALSAAAARAHEAHGPARDAPPDAAPGGTRILTLPGRNGNAGRAPWTSLTALDAAARFHFVVVADRTGGHRDGVFRSAMDKIDLLQPAFVISVGDLIEGYTRDRAQLAAEWDEIDRLVGTLDAPFFYTPGNHDYSNATMATVWAERYGPDYYALRYKGALFIVLNSALFDRAAVSGHGKRRGDWAQAQAAQLAWLEDTLAAHRDVRWTFLFMHRPYWENPWKQPGDDDAEVPATGPWPRHAGQPAQWRRVSRLLADRHYTAFAGHLHNYDYRRDDSGPHSHDLITLATTGGVGKLRGPAYGEFDHFLWVTLTEDGPVIANLLLDGILRKDIAQPFDRPWWAPRDPGDPLATDAGD